MTDLLTCYNSCQMFNTKRRSTLDSADKLKKQKQNECLFELDKCIQIPNDDKLIIRKLIKDNDTHILSIFQHFRREKSCSELQMRLRKFLQSYKQEMKRKNPTQNSEKQNGTKEHQRIYSQNSQQASYKNSIKCSPEKEDGKKKVINLDIGLLKEKIQKSVSNQSFTHLNHSLMAPTQRQPRKESLDQKKNISITKINAYVPSKQNTVTSSRYPLRSSSKDKENTVSSTSLSTRSQSKAQLFAQEGKHKDFSKITIRISSKPTLQNSIKQEISNKGASRPLQDISKQISYSSSIKNLLTAKIKDHKETSRKHENIYIKEDTEPSQDQNTIMTDIIRSFRDEKPTTIKRPAKPLHRDQPSCQMKLFDDSVPMYLKHGSASKQEPSVFTVRDNSNSKVGSQQQRTPLKLQYKFNQCEVRQKQNWQLMCSSQCQTIDEGHFFKKIRKIMQSTNL